MADYTAFVETGNAIVDFFRDSLTPEPIAEREAISLSSPHKSGNNQLTLFLYSVEEYRPNEAVGYINAGMDYQQRPPQEYVMRYLVTAHSKAPEQMREADQQRIIGAALQVLRDEPVLDPKYFNGSLKEEKPIVHIAYEKVPMEQLLKIWNDTSSPYKLSFVLLVNGIKIDSRKSRKIARITDVEFDTEAVDDRR